MSTEKSMWHMQIKLADWTAWLPISKRQFPDAHDAHKYALDVLCETIKPDGTVAELPHLISPIDNYKQWFAVNESRLLKATEHDVISLAMFEVAGWDRETAGNLADRYSNAYGVVAEEAGVEDLSEFLMALAELPNVQSGTYRNCLLYTSPSPRDVEESRMPSSA